MTNNVWSICDGESGVVKYVLTLVLELVKARMGLTLSHAYVGTEFKRNAEFNNMYFNLL